MLGGVNPTTTSERLCLTLCILRKEPIWGQQMTQVIRVYIRAPPPRRLRKSFMRLYLHCHLNGGLKAETPAQKINIDKRVSITLIPTCTNRLIVDSVPN